MVRTLAVPTATTRGAARIRFAFSGAIAYLSACRRDSSAVSLGNGRNGAEPDVQGHIRYLRAAHAASVEHLIREVEPAL